MNLQCEIGLRIRRLRLSKSMTQEELAKKVGYTSRSSINKIEKGMVDLPRSKIVELADALDTTASYLMGWDEEEQSPSSPLDGFHLQMLSSPDSANSPNRQKLIDWAMSVPEDKVEPVLQALETILAILK